MLERGQKEKKEKKGEEESRVGAKEQENREVDQGRGEKRELRELRTS